jgi:drug/metabolite transporter (DMT)-like permease
VGKHNSVFVVLSGWSEPKDRRLIFCRVVNRTISPESESFHKTRTNQFMSHHTLTARQYLILGLVSICAPLGDTCLSRGMTHLPPVTLAHPVTLIAAVFTPWIAIGIALLIGFFASYLTALSWADLTYVLPATAFGNVIVALLAKFWLHDTISLQRWAGIVLITVGVGFVAQGPSLTERPAAPPAETDLPALRQEEEQVR